MSLEDLSRDDLLWAYQMDVGHAKFEIERLKAENAALRERLDKAIELPSVREITVNTNGKPIIIYEAVYLNKYGCIMKNLYYNDKESAEARLKELKGE